MTTSQVMLAMKIAAAGGTPPSFRVAVKRSGAPTGGTTAGITTVTGDTIVIACTSQPSDDPATPTDSNTNTWTLVTNLSDANGRLKIWICSNATGGAGHTFTGGIASGTMMVSVYQAAATDSFDTDTLATRVTGTGSLTTAGTIDVANCLIYSACTMITGGDPITATASGYTVRIQESDNNSYWGGAVADKSPASTTAQSITWVLSSSDSTIVAIFAIKGV